MEFANSKDKKKNHLKIKYKINTKTPIKIEEGEWWFKGRIIQKQNHPSLAPYCSFNDKDRDQQATPHFSFKEAVEFCKKNPCDNPSRVPFDYGFGKSPYLVDILLDGSEPDLITVIMRDKEGEEDVTDKAIRH